LGAAVDFALAQEVLIARTVVLALCDGDEIAEAFRTGFAFLSLGKPAPPFARSAGPLRKHMLHAVILRIEHRGAVSQLVVETQEKLYAHLRIAAIHRAQMIADVAHLIAAECERPLSGA